jgi:cytochrome c oxidase assembly protein subunit 11
MGAPRHNNRTLALLIAVIGVMTGLAFASVPLYRLFCQTTGYGGTTQRAETAPGATGTRTVTVRFNADVAQGLPWRFEPEQASVVVRLGQSTLIYYRAENLSDERVTGQASYNVTPDQAGPYFSKISCFCFKEQTLDPHQKVDMPVTFFVDPAMLKDKDMAQASTITLSYTFFRAADSGKNDGRNRSPNS